MLGTRRSCYAALISTSVLIIGFLHLDARLSEGAMSALPTEGLVVLAVAMTSLLLWTVTYRSYRREIARRAHRKGRNAQRTGPVKATRPTDFLRAA